MKKSFLVFSMVITNSAFALTDQINLAEEYLKNHNSSILVDKSNSSTSEFIQSKKDIYKGQKSKEISALQKQWEIEETGIYDAEMFKKVKSLQLELGLNPTGIIDKNTWFAIYEQPQEWKNLAVSRSLENWKNIINKDINNKANKMIVINIPSMKLYAYDKKETNYELSLESPVVIGRNKTQTPLVDFEVLSLKYNPTWTPTYNILKRNLYKNGEINVDWIKSHGLIMYNESGEEQSIENIENIDIKTTRFTQSSGDGNALGNLKFETSSKENIYLHDTNERHLFNFNTRTYSSGCIRVKNYIDLAANLSSKKTEVINKNIAKKETYYEKLPVKIPVYFDYSQVHFNDTFDDNRFFTDIYNKNSF